MMPPQGPGAPAPQGAPQAAPQSPAPKPPGQGGAAQSVGMIEQGIKGLAPLVQQHADPQAQKLFQSCVHSFQAFVQHMSQPAGAPQPPAPAPKGPMPSAGGPKAQPLPQG